MQPHTPADPSSPLSAFRRPDDSGGLIDQATAGYLASERSGPTQPTLDAVLACTTRVRVLDDGVDGDHALGTTVLLDCADPAALAAFRDALAITEGAPGFRCMCLGDQAIELYAGATLLATIGLHHGRSIRWSAWKHDAMLRDGGQLLQWLAERGVTQPLAALWAEQRRAEEGRRASERWLTAMPACLRPFWPQMQGFDVPRDDIRAALAASFPDRPARILALLAWFGSGVGLWSGFPLYEQVAETLLLDEATATLIAALTAAGGDLTPAQLEGAARLFGSWTFRKQRPNDLTSLPAALRTRLLAAGLDSPSEDRRERAMQALASADAWRAS